MIPRLALLGAGGAIGTLARYGLNGLISGRQAQSWMRWASFPAGTLAVNVTGCLAIGLVAAMGGPESGRTWLPPEWRDFFMIGICGGYTTFSSYGLQTLNLIRDADWTGVTLNVLGSNVLGLVAVWLGWVAGAWLQSRIYGSAP